MGSFQLLDVVIGTVFVYLSLSLLCSGINEFIAKVLASRAGNLEKWLKFFFGNSGLFQKFQEHALIKGLTQQDKEFRRQTGYEVLDNIINWLTQPGKQPAYISSQTFMLALLDVVALVNPDDGKVASEALVDASNPNRTSEYFRERVKKLTDTAMKQTLLALIDDAGNDIEKLRQNIEGWFNDAMERLSGWYKRRTKLVILVLAIAVSIGLKADTFHVISSFYYDGTLRAAVVAAAQRVAAQPSATAGEQVQKELKQLTLPIGIGTSSTELIPGVAEPGWLMWVGYLITGFAVAQGAPFWFDVLNKLVNVRSTGDPPPTTSQK